MLHHVISDLMPYRFLSNDIFLILTDNRVLTVDEPNKGAFDFLISDEFCQKQDFQNAQIETTFRTFE